MVAMDDGYIKYTSHRREGEVAQSLELADLNRARTRLFDLGLVGIDVNGIGYGNLSLRTNATQFVITASATGALRELTMGHYSLVESYSLDQNEVWSMGGMDASSESMTHGAMYASNQGVHCVMHVHSRILFDRLLQCGMAATHASIPYGTPAMAHAVAEFARQQPSLPALLVMAGHDKGVIACGTNVGSVLDLIECTYGKVQQS
jgi:hypothetical protein